MIYNKEGAGNPYDPNLVNMVTAYATTDYQVVMEYSTESYRYLHLRGYGPFLAKYIFEQWDADDRQQYPPESPASPIVPSGSYNVTEAIAGEFVEISYNRTFLFGLDRTNTGSGGEGGFPPALSLAIAASATGAAIVILVGGYILVRNR